MTTNATAWNASPAGPNAASTLAPPAVSHLNQTPRHTTGTLVHPGSGQWSEKVAGLKQETGDKKKREEMRERSSSKSSPPYEGGVARVFCVTGWFSISQHKHDVAFCSRLREPPPAQGNPRRQKTPSGNPAAVPLLRKEGSYMAGVFSVTWWFSPQPVIL